MDSVFDMTSRDYYTQDQINEIMKKDLKHMTSEEKAFWNEEVLRQVSETRQHVNAQLESSKNTQRMIEDSLSQAKLLELRFQDFQDSYKRVCTKFASVLAEGLTTNDELQGTPQEITAEKAGQLLESKKKIMIITGENF